MEHRELLAYYLAIEKLQSRFEKGNFETDDVEMQVKAICQIAPETAKHAIDEAVAAIIFERSRQLINNRVLSRALMEARRHLSLSEADSLIRKARMDAEEDGEDVEG